MTKKRYSYALTGPYISRLYDSGHAQAMGPACLAVMFCLLRHIDSRWQCFPSVNTIASKIRRGRRWVQMCIGHLERNGYITRTAAAWPKAPTITILRTLPQKTPFFFHPYHPVKGAHRGAQKGRTRVRPKYNQIKAVLKEQQQQGPVAAAADEAEKDQEHGELRRLMGARLFNAAVATHGVSVVAEAVKRARRRRNTGNLPGLVRTILRDDGLDIAREIEQRQAAAERQRDAERKAQQQRRRAAAEAKKVATDPTAAAKQREGLAKIRAAMKKS